MKKNYSFEIRTLICLDSDSEPTDYASAVNFTDYYTNSQVSEGYIVYGLYIRNEDSDGFTNPTEWIADFRTEKEAEKAKDALEECLDFLIPSTI